MLSSFFVVFVLCYLLCFSFGLCHLLFDRGFFGCVLLCVGSCVFFVWWLVVGGCLLACWLVGLLACWLLFGCVLCVVCCLLCVVCCVLCVVYCLLIVVCR